jgi:hypothetical protein
VDDAWAQVGAVGAVIAALSAMIGVLLSRRAATDSRTSVTYELLRDARELVDRVRLMGDNTRFDDCNEAAAKLRDVVAVVEVDLPATRKLASTKWDLEAYASEHFQQQVADARTELEIATHWLAI